MLKKSLIIFLFVFLLSLVSITAFQKSYNFSSTYEGINMFAYTTTAFNQIIPPNTIPPNWTSSGGRTNITTDSDLDTNDGITLETLLNAIATTDGWLFLHAKFNENKSDIISINMSFDIGVNNAGGIMGGYVYNHTSNSWRHMFNRSIASSNFVYFTNTTTNDMINDTNELYFFVLYDNGAATHVEIDFIELTINYSGLQINQPTNSYEVLNNLSTILNISTAGYTNGTWYSLNNGQTNTTICGYPLNCADNQTQITFPRQGYFNLTVWANDSNNKIIEKNVTNIFVGNRTKYDFNTHQDILNASICDSINEIGFITPTGNPPTCNGASGWIDVTTNAALNVQDGSMVGVGLLFADQRAYYSYFNISTLNITNIHSISSIYHGEMSSGQPWKTFFLNTTNSWVEVNSGTQSSGVYYVNTTSTLTANISKYIINDTIYYIFTEDSDDGVDLKVDYPYFNITYYSPNQLPTITLTTSNFTNFTQQSIELNFTVTDDLSYGLNASLYINNSYNKSLYNPSQVTQNAFNLNISDGDYEWFVRVYDQDNGYNNSQTYFFTVRALTQISLIKPELGKVYAYNESLYLNYTLTNYTTISECWFSVYNTSHYEIANTTIGCTNKTFNVSRTGTYNLTLYTNTTNNDLSQASVTFTVNIDAPAINLIYPTNNLYLNSVGDKNFNATADDANGISVCQLWGNWSGWHLNQTNQHANSLSTQSNFTTYLADGSYVWNVFCNNSLNIFSSYTSNYTVTVDSKYPIINYTTSNSTSFTGLAATIGYNITELNPQSCSFTLYDSTGTVHNYAANSALSCTSTSKSLSTLNYGTYTLQITALDLANNLNSSNITFITVAATIPPSGGGGGGLPKKEEESCNQSGNDWDIKTTFGQDSYTFFIAYKTTRPLEKQIILTNYGLTNITIALSCQKTDENTKDICDYVNFSEYSFTIAPNTKEIKNIVMYIAYPINASLTDIFSFNVVANDGIACTHTLSNKAYITSFSLSRYSSIDLSALKPEWEEFNYPVVVVALTVWLCFILLGIYVKIKTKNSLLGYLGISTIMGAIAFVIVMMI